MMRMMTERKENRETKCGKRDEMYVRHESMGVRMRQDPEGDKEGSEIYLPREDRNEHHRPPPVYMYAEDLCRVAERERKKKTKRKQVPQQGNARTTKREDERFRVDEHVCVQ